MGLDGMFMGMGWKSLNALSVSAPLCGAIKQISGSKRGQPSVSKVRGSEPYLSQQLGRITGIGEQA